MAKNLIEVLIENDLNPKESSNGRWVLHCPFHEGDRDPSFTIYPNQTYWCFGCKVWGDAVTFLMKHKGISHDEALEYVGIDHKYPRSEKRQVIKLRNTIDSWKFLGAATDKYHQYLLQTQGAINYLYSRGLSDETISKYKLGYTDGYVLNLQFAEEYALAIEVGLTNRAGFEVLSHRITIPNQLEHGEVDFITGRTVTNDKIRYVNTRGSKPIQGFFEIRHSPVIFLVEGQMDWLILRQWGYPAAVMAGSHMTKANQALLESKQIVIVPDNDAIGKGVANEILGRFKNVTLFNYEDLGTKDIGQMAQEVDNAQGIFKEFIKEQCPWIFSFSKEILARYFPYLAKEMYFPSILKPQDSTPMTPVSY